VPKPKDGQIFTKPSKVSNNTTPSGVIINPSKIVTHPGSAQQDTKHPGVDPGNIVTNPGSVHQDTKHPGVDPNKPGFPSGPSQGGCGGPGEPACKAGGSGKGTGTCGQPGHPACKAGGSGNGNADSTFPAFPSKVIVINRDTEYRTRYVPVYRDKYVPVPERVISTPTAPATCLTKEYLQTGVVLFKDVCTKEWAVNSTTIDRPVTSATARACLTKENPANGVVLFKDICSNEWAMNPPEQAEAPQAR
jgi:hypothetical protein